MILTSWSISNVCRDISARRTNALYYERTVCRVISLLLFFKFPPQPLLRNKHSQNNHRLRYHVIAPEAQNYTAGLRLMAFERLSEEPPDCDERPRRETSCTHEGEVRRFDLCDNEAIPRYTDVPCNIDLPILVASTPPTLRRFETRMLVSHHSTAFYRHWDFRTM